jgi:hypothetical protein
MSRRDFFWNVGSHRKKEGVREGMSLVTNESAGEFGEEVIKSRIERLSSAVG